MISCEEIISTQHPNFFLCCWKQDFHCTTCKWRGTLQAAQNYSEKSDKWLKAEAQLKGRKHTCGSRIAWVLIQLHNVSVSFFRHENHGLCLCRTDRNVCHARTGDLCCLLVLPPSWAPAGHVAMAAGTVQAGTSTIHSTWVRINSVEQLHSLPASWITSLYPFVWNLWLTPKLEWDTESPGQPEARSQGRWWRDHRQPCQSLLVPLHLGTRKAGKLKSMIPLRAVKLTSKKSYKPLLWRI